MSFELQVQVKDEDLNVRKVFNEYVPNVQVSCEDPLLKARVAEVLSQITPQPKDPEITIKIIKVWDTTMNPKAALDG